MAQHSAWKKALLTTLVFSMISAGAAYADESETGAGAAAEQAGTTAAGDSSAQSAVRPSTPFTDVKNGHWAEKHIAKLNLQGIVQGYQGKFRPADNVTQQEAVVMALRFMGLADGINTDDPVILPSAFTVNKSYKAYVAVALQHNLLDQDEEYVTDASGSEDAWGKKPATREWITKLAVRAIGQQKLALEMDGSTAAFSDANQIGAGFAGYVNAATTLELVKGVTPDKFDPKGLINRAQLATLFSRAEAQHNIVYKGQVSGIVTLLNDTTITLYSDNGRNTSYAITPETLLYRYDSEQAVQLSQLQPYTNATVIASQGNALYIEQQGGEQQVEAVEGTLVSVDRDNGMLYIRVGSSIPSIPFDSGLVVTDGSGGAVELEQLAEGSTVKVLRETFRPEKLAVKVEVKGAPVSKTGTGTVYTIGSGKVSIEDEVDGTREWSIAASAVVTRLGAAATLADVKPGDSVTYTVEKDLIVSIAIDSSANQTVSGQFYSVGDDNKLLNYTVGGKLNAKFVIAGATLAIPGIDNPTWNDLAKDDALEITLNGLDQVTAVKVVNLDVSTINGASVIDYNRERRTLTFWDGNGPQVVTLTDRTRIEMNGTPITLEAAAVQLSENRKFSIIYSEKTAVSIKFIYKYSGTLTSLNATARTMTLKLSDGSTVTLPYSTAGIEIYGKASASLTDIKTGDPVTLLLDNNQDRILSVLVHQVVQQKIVSVDAASASKKVKLMAADGTTTEYAVGTDWTYADENGSALTLAQLSAGQYVNVTFAGKQPVAFKRVTVTYGQVTEVSAAGISVKDFNGRTIDTALGSDYRVVRGGTTTTGSIAGIAAGDRVEVRKDDQGKAVVTVVAGVAKTFRLYDITTKTIHTVNLGNTKNAFTVVPDTLITSGGAIIPVTSLKFNDSIVVYEKDGILIEVAKQNRKFKAGRRLRLLEAVISLVRARDGQDAEPQFWPPGGIGVLCFRRLLGHFSVFIA